MLTCSKSKNLVTVDDIVVLIQKPLRSKFVWFWPHLGIGMDSSRIETHKCVLN